MITGLTHATVVVKDYDDAIKSYTEKLGLELRMDNTFGEGFRFVTVAVKGQDVEIVLHKPQDGQSGGPTEAANSIHGLVFSTDDCHKDADGLKRRGVTITQGPEDVPWGVQAVFEDLYGNSHVLVEAKPYAPPSG